MPSCQGQGAQEEPSTSARTTLAKAQSRGHSQLQGMLGNTGYMEVPREEDRGCAVQPAACQGRKSVGVWDWLLICVIATLLSVNDLDLIVVFCSFTKHSSVVK